MNAAANLAWQPLGNLCDKIGIVPLAHRRIEINQLHEREPREFLYPVVKIVKRKTQLLALNQLHDTTAHQIDRRNQHGSLTETPAAASSCFNDRALDTPK